MRNLFKNPNLKRPAATIAIALALISTVGCQNISKPEQAGINARADDVSAELTVARTTFLQSDDFAEQITRLAELEQQALQLAVDEPLKLGSLGSAILDIYPGSQTGHYVMSQFYKHVESSEAQATHDQQLAKLQSAMRASGTGDHDAPYQVMTIYDAHAYAKTRETSPVGAIYQSSEHATLAYMLVARPKQAPLQQSFFDLSHLLERPVRALAERDSDNRGQDDAPQNLQNPSHLNPWSYIRERASGMDNAAQAAIGAYLSTVDKVDDAIGWLRVAARSDNVLANRLLARLYWSQVDATQDDAEKEGLKELALENHLHAIALGSTDSMYTLANLYLNDVYGEDNSQAGVALLHQGADMKHAESLMYLGHLYSAGQHVEADADKAADYFKRAAQTNKPRAVLNYGRFLLGAKAKLPADAQTGEVYSWLERLAEQDNPEAMIVLGNLYARGVGISAAPDTAVEWYKRAVRTAKDDAEVVNEVAWTLAVSDINPLKRTRYAKRIMDKLMKGDDDARAQPEYLDTWAATCAARGDFECAIDLQTQAIAAAVELSRADVLEVLQQHLKQFKAGVAITEQAP